jgi:L-asparaginase
MKKICIYIAIILFSASSMFAKNIVIVATGGTIAGSAKSSTQTVGYKAGSVGVDEIIQSVPELANIKDAKITSEQVLQIGSENFTNEDLLKLAKRVKEILKTSDAVVITHGTDTLEETAYFLNLVINTDKPIILVGSMRPSSAISADGAMNLYNSVLVANSADSKKRGVMVVFNDNIFDARNVTKSNSYKVDAFSSPNTGAIGFVHNGKISFTNNVTTTNTFASEFDIDNIKKLPQVDILVGSSGATSTYIDAARKAKIDAIIYAGTGNGSLATPIIKELTNARADGIMVVRASRISAGHVARDDEMDKNGFIASYDLSPQKARILMMVGLTKSKDEKYLQGLFSKY